MKAKIPPAQFNIRDTSGRVVGVGILSRSKVQVSSFGRRLDRFLDKWGFKVHTIVQLATAWSFSRNEEDFVRRMGEHGMGGSEAAWFWEEFLEEGGIRETREGEKHGSRNSQSLLLRSILW